MAEKKFKTTKADERAALLKIKTILAELDPDGYVNTAFEGCCDIAESNIKNDFANSYKTHCEYLQEELRKMRVAQGDLETRFNTVEKFYKHRGELLEATFEQIDYYRDKSNHLESENKKFQTEKEVLQVQIKAANRLIEAYRVTRDIDNERIDKLKKTNACLLDSLNRLKQI